MFINSDSFSDSSSAILSKRYPQSAGFGIVGLVGPLASIDAGLNVALAAIVWFVVPIAAAIAKSKILFEKVLKLYDSSVVSKFQE